MKRKVISFLFGLMLIFGVMGCEQYASESSFFKKDQSVYFATS